MDVGLATILAAVIGGAASLTVTGAAMAWRRRHQAEAKTFDNSERLARVEARLGSLERTTEVGFARLSDKIDSLLLRGGGCRPPREREPYERV